MGSIGCIFVVLLHLFCFGYCGLRRLVSLRSENVMALLLYLSDRTFQSPPEHFAIREVRWRLAANAMQGQIEADLEVDDHDLYEFRWYIREPGSARGRYVDIPVTRSPNCDLYVQRFWSNGRPFISGHLSLHPVPPVGSIDIVLEVITIDYGPKLQYTFSASIAQHHNAPRQRIIPDMMQPVAFPQPKQQAGDEQTTLEYSTRTVAVRPAVDVYFAQVSDDLTRLFNRFSLVGTDVMAEYKDMENDEVQTTVSVSIGEETVPTMYKIVLLNLNQTLEYYLLVSPGGSGSFFTDVRIGLDTCSGITGSPQSDDVMLFELSSFGADCIRCMVAAPGGGINMQMTIDGLPIGSGSTHSVFWNRISTDMAVAYFVLHDTMYTYMYQSFSYAGLYSCEATTADGRTHERQFQIDFV